MFSRVAMLSMLTALAACGGGQQEDVVVSMYKSRDSVQCGPAGAPPSEFQRQLADAGVRVVAASCGTDGQAYPAACGAPDGAIVVFELPAEQAPIAASLAFAPLSNLPTAQIVPCN